MTETNYCIRCQQKILVRAWRPPAGQLTVKERLDLVRQAYLDGRISLELYMELLDKYTEMLNPSWNQPQQLL